MKAEGIPNFTGRGCEGEDISKKKDGSIRKMVLCPGTDMENPNPGATCTVRVAILCRNISPISDTPSAAELGDVKSDRQFVTFRLGEGTAVGVAPSIEWALRRFKRGERSQLRVTSQPDPEGWRPTNHDAAFRLAANQKLAEVVVYEVELTDFVQMPGHWELDLDQRIEVAEAFKQRGTDFFKEGKFLLAKRNYKRAALYLQHGNISVSLPPTKPPAAPASPPASPGSSPAPPASHDSSPTSDLMPSSSSDSTFDGQSEAVASSSDRVKQLNLSEASASQTVEQATSDDSLGPDLVTGEQDLVPWGSGFVKSWPDSAATVSNLITKELDLAEKSQHCIPARSEEIKGQIEEMDTNLEGLLKSEADGKSFKGSVPTRKSPNLSADLQGAEPGRAEPRRGAERLDLLIAAYLNLALCYLRLGRNLSALEACDRALEINARSTKGLYRRGLAHLAMDNLDSAVDDLSAAHDLDPSDSVVGARLALARQRLKEYNEGQRRVYAGMFTKFATLDSTREAALNSGQADVFSQIGEWSNDLAKDMITLEQEMEAFGEVMPAPRYPTGGANGGGLGGEEGEGDSESD